MMNNCENVVEISYNEGFPYDSLPKWFKSVQKDGLLKSISHTKNHPSDAFYNYSFSTWYVVGAEHIIGEYRDFIVRTSDGRVSILKNMRRVDDFEIF